jgi:glycosyltransferase involved in cell wall biosynthesis
MDAVWRDYDIVQYHAVGSAPLAWVPRVWGKTTTVSVRGLDGQRAKWGRIARHYLRFCEWASIACPTATLVVSKTLERYYAETYGRQPICIPNGVGPSLPVPAQEIARLGLTPRSYILYVGRLTPEKECHTLIDAYERLDTSLKLVFAGSSTYAGDYVNALHRHRSDRILFLGFQQGRLLAELFSHAYLYVLPSRIEGLSVSLLEAMGYGACVVTSDIPENRELAERAGFTFQVGDVVDLAHRLASLIDRPDLVAATGHAARALIQREYLWDRIAEATEAAYQALLARRAGTSPVPATASRALVTDPQGRDATG